MSEFLQTRTPGKASVNVGWAELNSPISPSPLQAAYPVLTRFVRWASSLDAFLFGEFSETGLELTVPRLCLDRRGVCSCPLTPSLPP